MNNNLTLSENLFARLQMTAKRRGFHSIEQLLEAWQACEEEMLRRAGHGDDGREDFFAYYGERTSVARQEPMGRT